MLDSILEYTLAYTILFYSILYYYYYCYYCTITIYYCIYFFRLEIYVSVIMSIKILLWLHNNNKNTTAEAKGLSSGQLCEAVKAQKHAGSQ